MSAQTDLVRDHYQAAIADQDELIAKLASTIEAMDGPLTPERLASFDQFHIGGLAATAELARRVAPAAGMTVLDAGSGLGGPSRYLADTFGCRVTGIDLAPAYVAIAELVASRMGLGGRTDYQVGSITDLPFGDATFDLVWTQHVVMNIRDRDGLYRGIRRVLKPNGRFAFFDPYLPDNGEPVIYPVPWAGTPDISTLLTQDETAASLQQAGLRVTEWDDVTEAAKSWITQQQQAIRPGVTGSGLSPAFVVGARMLPMVANFVRNIMEGRVRLVMGLCDSVSPASA